MARSIKRSTRKAYRKEARRGQSKYGSANAADIARFGVNRIWENAGEPKDGLALRLASDGEARDGAVIEGHIVDADEMAQAASAAVVPQKARIARQIRRVNLVSSSETDAQEAEERSALRRKVVVWAVILVVLFFVSLGFMGAAGDNYGLRYAVFSPLDVAQTLWAHVYNFAAETTHLFLPDYSVEKTAYYRAFSNRVGVVVITLICAVLLSVSGMLYQNVFKNPIAGPGMLGVSSGVSLGMMLVVYLYGANAMGAVTQRYIFCYGLGAAVLIFVVLFGRKLSGKGKPFDIVTMLLVGMIFSQLIGFVTQYYTLFVMNPDLYQIYITISQMLVVDTSLISWVCLTVATVVSLVPVVLLRFRLNVLAFNEDQARLWGVNLTMLRGVALVCGAIMILAAQIHIGAVAMVSLIVPFLSRSWFGVEFRKQLVGNICISTVLLLICRDVVDLIPFVGDGIGIGSAVAVVALPLFLLIMARGMKGWN